MRTPSQLGLPNKFTSWRLGQGEAVEKIAASQEDVFLLDAPWGLGKSLIGIGVYKSRIHSTAAIEVMERLSGTKSKPQRCIYITPTKQLQDQIVSEFPEARTIKGRSNYPCPKNPKLTAEDCTNTEDNPCPHRHTNFGGAGAHQDQDGQIKFYAPCPYYAAKGAALSAPLAVLNTSYYLTEINGPGQFSGADLLIVDEVDSLENSLMSHIEMRITSQQLAQFNIEFPDDPHSLRGWRGWASMLDLTDQVSNLRGFQGIPEVFWTDIEIGQLKRLKRLEGFYHKIQTFNADVNDNWLFDERIDEKGGYTWSFKPVKVDAYAEEYLWRHSDSALGMSATIMDPAIIADDLGIRDYGYLLAECPFPLVNRPIYYTPVVNLTAKTMQQELPRLADAVNGILLQYPDDKVLVHTTTFAIRNYLLSKMSFSDRIITHDTADRAEKLIKFMQSRKPLVMLSPSMDRGLDLFEDLCRCVIICKVPYVSMGDNQVKARMATPGGQRWYLLKAAQTVMQMSGRGVRGDMDKCDTWILDRQFGSLLSRMNRYFPTWWVDAIFKK